MLLDYAHGHVFMSDNALLFSTSASRLETDYRDIDNLRWRGCDDIEHIVLFFTIYRIPES